MQTTSPTNTANGNPLRRALLCLAILSIIAAATACSGYLVPERDDGSIKEGKWIGKSDDGAFSMKFNIGGDKASVALIALSLPCGEQTLYISGGISTKVELHDRAFEATIEHTSFGPRVVVTGKYTDRTHAEGTWEMPAFGSLSPDMACPAASGTWTGSPE